MTQPAWLQGFGPFLRNSPKTAIRPALNVETFEKLLDELCERLTQECRAGHTFGNSKAFEHRVREIAQDLLAGFGIAVDFYPHPFGFPDIVLGEFGVEVKFTVNDTWRSVAQHSRKMKG